MNHDEGREEKKNETNQWRMQETCKQERNEGRNKPRKKREKSRQ